MPDSNAAIAAVNHWRGQCLDKYARVEHAIIACIERWIVADPKNAPTLAESASARTRNLAAALKKHRPDDPQAKSLAKLLDLWRYREKQRNEMVHGLFTIKSHAEGWALINLTRTVKKQVSTLSEDILTEAEAQARLHAVITERKTLEAALSALSFD